MTSPLIQLFSNPVNAIAIVVAFLLAVALHELSHALAATAQGDPTPRAAGRLSLNPLRHLDPFGTITLILVGFGWGSTPVDPRRFRSGRLGEVLVSLAGPATNLVLALATALTFRFAVPNDSFAFTLLVRFFQMNVILLVFNLLPIPPLDGSKVLIALLPPGQQGIARFLEQYGVYLLLGLVLLPLAYPQLDWLGPLLQRAEVGLLRLVGVA
ncbi:MAG TPA: site-2 protease family protein [Actinomycetes bacterium]|nr:site-2 protease family protein [Actinomycetes bacterium]